MSLRKQPLKKAQVKSVDQSDQELIKEREKWDRIQKKTFRTWINHTLHVRGLSIENSIETDLSDGVLLINLLEVLSGKAVGKYRVAPSSRFLKIENVAIALRFIRTDLNLELYGVSAEDIVDGNPKIILGMIWRLIQTFRLSLPGEEDEKETSTSSSTTSSATTSSPSISPPRRSSLPYVSTASHQPVSHIPKETPSSVPASPNLSSSPTTTRSSSARPPSEETSLRNSTSSSRTPSKFKDRLLNWLKSQLADYTPHIVKSISDFDTSFADGLAFCALIHKQFPEAIDLHSLSSDDPSRNLTLAFSMAEEKLDIPKLLDPSDLLSGKPDELSVMTYVSEFFHVYSVLDKQKKAKEKEKKQNEKRELQAQKLKQLENLWREEKNKEIEMEKEIEAMRAKRAQWMEQQQQEQARPEGERSSEVLRSKIEEAKDKQQNWQAQAKREEEELSREKLRWQKQYDDFETEGKEALAEKEATIARMDVEMERKEREKEEKDQMIREKEAEIQLKDEENSRLREEIRKLEALIEEKDALASVTITPRKRLHQYPPLSEEESDIEREIRRIEEDIESRRKHLQSLVSSRSTAPPSQNLGAEPQATNKLTGVPRPNQMFQFIRDEIETARLVLEQLRLADAFIQWDIESDNQWREDLSLISVSPSSTLSNL